MGDGHNGPPGAQELRNRHSKANISMVSLGIGREKQRGAVGFRATGSSPVILTAETYTSCIAGIMSKAAGLPLIQSRTPWSLPFCFGIESGERGGLARASPKVDSPTWLAVTFIDVAGASLQRHENEVRHLNSGGQLLPTRTIFRDEPLKVNKRGGLQFQQCRFLYSAMTRHCVGSREF